MSSLENKEVLLAILDVTRAEGFDEQEAIEYARICYNTVKSESSKIANDYDGNRDSYNGDKRRANRTRNRKMKIRQAADSKYESIRNKLFPASRSLSSPAPRIPTKEELQRILELNEIFRIEETDDEESNGGKVLVSKKPSFLLNYPVVEEFMDHLEDLAVTSSKIERSLIEIEVDLSDAGAELLELFRS